MTFEFATAGRIVFGAGKVREAGGIARDFGSRALVVTGRTAGRAAPLIRLLKEHGVEAVTFRVAGEPTLSLVQQATRAARDGQCELVVGIGGGSVIDTGKAVSALLTNGGDLLDYLEVIGGGKPLVKNSAPFIAIPTTAGTGAEATRNAVIESPEHKVKVSLRSALMLPRVALVDPELTYPLPREVTASAGLDALTQLIEVFVSVRANPMTDALCREGIPRVARSLRRAYENGRDAAAREDMALAALFSGIGLANAGLGAVHGFAAPVGGMFHAPHGAVCAALLPHVMEANRRALRARQPDGEALRRYEEIDRFFGGDAVAWITETCRMMKIPPLSAYGVTKTDFPALIEKAAASNSVKGNPVGLTEEELGNILEQCLSA